MERADSVSVLLIELGQGKEEGNTRAAELNPFVLDGWCFKYCCIYQRITPASLLLSVWPQKPAWQSGRTSDDGVQEIIRPLYFITVPCPCP